MPCCSNSVTRLLFRPLVPCLPAAIQTVGTPSSRRSDLQWITADPHCRLGSNGHHRDEKSTSVESLPVARTGSGSPADDRPKWTRQRHDDVLAYDRRV